jgi:hypothetical protein
MTVEAALVDGVNYLLRPVLIDRQRDGPSPLNPRSGKLAFVGLKSLLDRFRGETKSDSHLGTPAEEVWKCAVVLPRPHRIVSLSLVGLAACGPSSKPVPPTNATPPITSAAPNAETASADKQLDGWVTVLVPGARVSVLAPPDVRREVVPFPSGPSGVKWSSSAPKSGATLSMMYFPDLETEDFEELRAALRSNPQCGGALTSAKKVERIEEFSSERYTITCVSGTVTTARFTRISKAVLVQITYGDKKQVGWNIEADRFLNSLSANRPEPPRVPTPWRTFVRPEGHFKVDLPATAMEIEKELDGTTVPDKTTKHRIVMTPIGNVQAALFTSDYTPDIPPATAMESFVDGMSRGKCGGGLITRWRADLGPDHLVMRFQIRCPTHFVLAGDAHAHHGRIQVVGVGVAENEDRVRDDDLDHFFSSYEVLP